MPFLKFGKKKDGEDDDIEAPEDNGLLMSTKGEQPTPASADPDAAEGQATDAETPGGEAAEGGDPLLEAALADPVAEEETAAEATGDSEEKEKSDAADLMSAFQEDEPQTDLADLVEGVEDVAASSLLEELREIRLQLPPEALDPGETAA